MKNEAITQRPLAVSIARAAEMTSLCQRTIRNYVLDGKLAGVKCGTRIIIPIEALEELVQNGIAVKSNDKENKR